MTSRPRKRRYALGDAVGRFAVTELLPRGAAGKRDKEVVWWYGLKCRICGHDREASQKVMRQAERGRSLSCRQCRALALPAAFFGRARRREYEVDDAWLLDPGAEPEARVAPAPVPPQGSAAALWLAVMGLA